MKDSDIVETVAEFPQFQSEVIDKLWRRGKGSMIVDLTKGRPVGTPNFLVDSLRQQKSQNETTSPCQPPPVTAPNRRSSPINFIRRPSPPQWDDHVRISRVHVKLTVAGNSHLSRDDSHVWFRPAPYQLDHVTGGPGRAGFELSSLRISLCRCI
ncbi:hypothetical protein RRG08_028399 [Elysia crispata]|uniref:Uncharacterized protein n=1 Tax=Elysia crispata TaxID=231223 RepID=A0AAE0Y342_9GAST|nr:hypothetical protein RRG08_028399 [Elysia crispata]